MSSCPSLSWPALRTLVLRRHAHTLDPDAQANDHVAPTLPPPTLFKIDRGHDTGGACGDSSCDGLGAIAFSVAATDDATPEDKWAMGLLCPAGGSPTDSHPSAPSNP